VIVEDRAQALDAGPVHGWAVYSPRKLLGVADGGILVAPAGESPPQPIGEPDVDRLWRAAELRLEQPTSDSAPEWHGLNQSKEAAMGIERTSMTAASLEILSRSSIATLIQRRRSNWQLLDSRLKPWSAHPSGQAAPPLGYVLRLERKLRDALLNHLHSECIFAAVHWPELPVARDVFPKEWEWTSELLTLPCDHRYGEAEMGRIADSVARFLG